MNTNHLAVPPAPHSISKGVPVKNVLNCTAVTYLANNLAFVYPSFDKHAFIDHATVRLETLSLMQRAHHIADALESYLPSAYTQAIKILLASFTPARTTAESFGLETFFYLPHGCFIAKAAHPDNNVLDNGTFICAMHALHALTMVFTSEFAIRPFLINHPTRTLAHIKPWINDPNPHVRRLCSEGTRPLLPWGKRLPHFIANPELTLPIIEALKDDQSLYVRRSVANHLGDIGKHHPQLACKTAEQWLHDSPGKERLWVIRHSLRYLVKHQHPHATAIHKQARA